MRTARTTIGTKLVPVPAHSHSVVNDIRVGLKNDVYSRLRSLINISDKLTGKGRTLFEERGVRVYIHTYVYFSSVFYVLKTYQLLVKMQHFLLSHSP